MRARTILRLLLSSQHSSTSSSSTNSVRFFTSASTSHTTRRHISTRPQLPFLSLPTRQQWRYLTTERKARFKHDALLAVRYAAYAWAIVGCLTAAAFAVSQERMERRYPTPHEWSFWSRLYLRDALTERDRTDRPLPHWVLVVQLAEKLVRRLEDENGDGRGVKVQDGVGRSERGKREDGMRLGRDVRGMPENWRRGYFQALMLVAAASENVEGWVVDTTRGICFPPEMVIGPSNPNPKPIPPGSKGAPREENCQPAGYPNPKDVYTALMTTLGFSKEQYMEIALAYASWAEYKGDTEMARLMHKQALAFAVDEEYGSQKTPESLLDARTGALKYSGLDSQPSANIVKTLHQQAIFEAQSGNPATALPLLTSLLQYRRSFTSVSTATMNQPEDTSYNIFTPKPYPALSNAGRLPPVRDSQGLCEEAALHLHIGEIMYTLQQTTREEGLAWTREGVDIAEEELHKIAAMPESTGLAFSDKDRAKTSCRQCLRTGLDNWATMVNRLAKEEAKRETAAPVTAEKPSTWLGLWGSGSGADAQSGRWAAEEKVVRDRTRRANELLEDIEKPDEGPLARLLKA